MTIDRDKIYIVGFYKTDKEIKKKIKIDCNININRFKFLEGGDRPMEFVLLLEQLHSMTKNIDNSLVGFGNDTILHKEYNGILRDLYNIAENTRDVQIPAITGVIEKSMHGISASRNSGNCWHLRSHFFWVNSHGVELLKSISEKMNSIINGLDISPTSKMIADNYFAPEDRERKARAIECEKYIGNIFMDNGIVMPHNLSRKIEFKRSLSSLISRRKLNS